MTLTLVFGGVAFVALYRAIRAERALADACEQMNAALAREGASRAAGLLLVQDGVTEGAELMLALHKRLAGLEAGREPVTAMAFRDLQN